MFLPQGINKLKSLSLDSSCIFSCVYKCVCQQHSEIMYDDLIRKITTYLERVSDELQVKACPRGEKRLHFYSLV